MLVLDKWKSINKLLVIDKYPELPCPYCGNDLQLEQETISYRALPKGYQQVSSRDYQGYLKESQQRQENAANSIKRAFDDNAFWGVFATIYHASEELKNANQVIEQCTAFLCCKACNGSVAAVGLAKSTMTETRRSQTSVKFEYFTPTIPMMGLSRHTPPSIQKELVDAFKHYHFDPLSAASKLRRAIEQFCDDQDAKGGNLHQKISSLTKSSPEEAQYLMALKLVGNEGTHAFDVDEDDLLKAFSIFSVVLELYDRRARFQETLPNYNEIISKFDQADH